jgi:hypothetical protein
MPNPHNMSHRSQDRSYEKGPVLGFLSYFPFM